MNRKIVFIHSLNNYTGSPNILSIIVKGFRDNGYQVSLITSKGVGFLSNIGGVKYQYTCYRWTKNKLFTLILLIISQIQVFFKLLLWKKTNTIFYINTIVPFGAALACKLTSKDYVYHVHEDMQQKKLIYSLFRRAYKSCNTKSIFVSNYLKSTAKYCKEGYVIYNALSRDFLEHVKNFEEKRINQRKTILFVSSLRKFKGVYEFVELAKRLTHLKFEMVLSAQESEVEQFSRDVNKPMNLNIFPIQTNLHPFYQRAKILLQLSHPEFCTETFGLSILEAMVYGIPSIVPNVGGPTELVVDGFNGFQVNPHDLNLVQNKIEFLVDNENIYSEFSNNALLKSKQFGEIVMHNEIEKYILQ